jgi:hypothetical protein
MLRSCPLCFAPAFAVAQDIFIFHHPVRSLLHSSLTSSLLLTLAIMAPPTPSIQSYFSYSPSKPRRSSPSPPSKATQSATGDGFTAQETEAVLHTSPDEWLPSQHYEEMNIGSLLSGPKCVTFTGRIVNIYDQCTPSQRAMAAKGCLKMIVADDTGALTVESAPSLCPSKS